MIGSARTKKRANESYYRLSRQSKKHMTNKDRDNKDTQHSVGQVLHSSNNENKNKITGRGTESQF